jgi:hypothetical protein
MEGQDKTERDYESYKLLLDLWSKENPIKTTKLQVLLVVNGLMVSAINIGGGPLVDPKKWYIYVAGTMFNAIWTLSIGRTVLFQDLWQLKLRELRDRYPDDPRFTIIETAAYRSNAARFVRLFGCMSSKRYLLFSPFLFAMIWLAILIATRF